MTEQSAELFAKVHRVFGEKGLLGRSHRIMVGKRKVRVLCDEASFTVYAVNEYYHLPPGVPGWMVCRLTASDFCAMAEDQPDFEGECEEGNLDSAAVWVEAVLGSIK